MHLARLGDQIVVEEILPDPDHLPLKDERGERVTGADRRWLRCLGL
jgi:hypothetical protein